jgi:AcrR family transcriptional regulator
LAREARVRRLPPEERREQIVAAVLRVVAEYGVPEATIARIAKAAGVSEGTLYVYFASRREMLLAALESILDEMYRLIDGSDGPDALTRLQNIEEAHAKQMGVGRGLLAYPWFEFIAAGPQMGIRDAVADTHRHAYEHLKGIIQEGKARGTIRVEVDPDRLAWGFYTVLWAENIACMMGMTEYLCDGHAAHILGLILADAAVRRPSVQ